MITVEPTTVWAAFGGFVLGMIVGALIVLDEMKRVRRRWREATRTWHEIEAVAVELRGEHTELPPDMVAAIRESVTEELKKRSARR